VKFFVQSSRTSQAVDLSFLDRAFSLILVPFPFLLAFFNDFALSSKVREVLKAGGDRCSRFKTFP